MDKKTLTKELEKMQVRYNRILDASFEEIYIFDASTLLFLEVSKGTVRNLGYSLDEIKTLTPIDIKPLISKAQFDEIVKPLLDGSKELVTFETIHARKNESFYDVSVRLQYSGGDDPVFIAMITDITNRKRYEEELRILAFKDAGSGLYNKRFFVEELEVTMRKSRRDSSAIGVILIDLDDFTAVNTNFGHVAGDALITEIGTRIKTVFSRGGDLVARYGGDEFIVMCHNSNLADLNTMCQELVDVIGEDFMFNSSTIKPSASVGLCFSDCKDFSSAEDFIQEADTAMYAAKDSGKNSFSTCERCSPGVQKKLI